MDQRNLEAAFPPITNPNDEDQVVHLRSWKLAVVIGTLFVGIFLYGLDVNVIGVAVPKITTEFGSLDQVAWYGSAYLLTVTVFQPGFGNFYRYFNVKIVYLGSLVIFEVGSAICAAAPRSDVLIFGRALLGVGAAGLLQGALAIISYVIPLDKVPAYQGIVIAAMGVSVCIGPVVGGALTEYTSWRWCFWINVPIGVVVIIFVFLFVPIARTSNHDKQLPLADKLRHMDPIGTILFLGAICCLLLALLWGGQTYAWNDSVIIGLFVGFGAIGVCFCFWLQRQGEVALIPLRILRKRSIAMGSVTLFSISLALNVYGYYLPIFFQSAQGASVTISGVRLIPLIVPNILAIGIVGLIVTKWGYYVPYMVLGSAIASVGSGLLTTIDMSTPTVKWAAYLVITGIGIGMAFQLPYTAVQAVLEPADLATGNAIAVFSSQLAGAIGVAIGQDLLINKLGKAVPQYTDKVSPAQVMVAGASGLVDISPSPEALAAVRHAYSDAVRWTIILGLAANCLAVPSSCAMEWLNIKSIAEQRKVRDETQANEPIHTPKSSQSEPRAEMEDEKKTVSDIRVNE